MTASVLAVHRSDRHGFSKPQVARIVLLAGLGVEGDTHSGVTVQHRSRVARDPTQPNQRQVHLLQAELLDELGSRGMDVRPGGIGENVTTRGIDLLSLPEGTRLALGPNAVVEVTGLRNPCAQLDAFIPGLMKAVLGHTPGGELLRKAGVMGVVLQGGVVGAGDPIVVHPPAQPHRRLRPV